MAGGFFSVHLGQDANWDLKNYHLYNAWSFFNHKLSADYFAAGIQTYFPPWLDLPYYLISTKFFPGAPRLVAFLMGLPYGLLLFVVFRLSWVVLGSEIAINPTAKIILSALAGFYGVSGVATVSQVGTTFNEVTTASIILLGLLFMVEAVKSSTLEMSDNPLFVRIFLSGILVGIAAGLKLTSVIYAPGIAILAFCINGNLWSRMIRFSVFCLAWVFGFMPLWGAWGLRLYELTGNPFFPMFNSIFHSPWISPSSGMDERFFPDGFLQAIFYPFYWMADKKMTVMEPSFSDPRFAIAMTVFFLAIICLVVAFWYGRKFRDLKTFTPALAIVVFVVISYPIWEALFSIMRYVVPVEAILGIFIVSICIRIFAAFHKSINGAFLFVFLAVISLGASAATSYPLWGRVPFSKNVFEVQAPEIPEGSLVLFLDKPLAFLAPFLAQGHNNVGFIGIVDNVAVDNHSLVQTKVRNEISKWQGPIFYVARKDSMARAADLKRFGLYPGAQCWPIRSNIDATNYLGTVSRVPNDRAWPTDTAGCVRATSR